MAINLPFFSRTLTCNTCKYFTTVLADRWLENVAFFYDDDDGRAEGFIYNVYCQKMIDMAEGLFHNKNEICIYKLNKMN